MSDTTNDTQRKQVWFTFGNHMHWVDMQWLWGYSVLPGSVRDMLHLCRETGARGNVNFDGVGYEKMAAECPDALMELRDAVQQGFVEPVGCSYGQPYGLFHGGESNVRQFTYGVRSVRRLLGVRPRSFWEEEFYFFPQLPQILRSCGFTAANLFFQWTWHTPEIPKEPHALVLWEGVDGTRIPALTRNELNLHQWPEDFAPLFESSLLRDLDQPAIVQWIELMPSRDWMCRSEVLLPKLKELLAHPQLDIVPGTMSEVVKALLKDRREGEEVGASSGHEMDARAIPVRRYTMDDVWHGMTLGKNADRHPRTSRDVEGLILGAESLAATASLFGRPYPSWDVYPTWELDEAWRELLAAQHHDNHECEGLCGFVGYHQMERARSAALEVGNRSLRQLADRVGTPLIWNGAAAPRRMPDGSLIPPFGYAPSKEFEDADADVEVETTDDGYELRRGSFRVEVDSSCRIRQIYTREFPEGVLHERHHLLDFCMVMNGETRQLRLMADITTRGYDGHFKLMLAPSDHILEEKYLGVEFCIASDAEAIDFRITSHSKDWPQPDAGLLAALKARIGVSFPVSEVRADTPYAAGAVNGTGRVRRKYPSGDWMTSEQWFEELDRAVTSHSFVDLLREDGAGLFIAHTGSQQMFRNDDGVDVVLDAYDPWDERRREIDSSLIMALRIEPHAAWRDSDRIRRASTFQIATVQRTSQFHPSFDSKRLPGTVGGGGPAEPGTAPSVFGAFAVENAPGVLATAFYRESMKSGEHFPNWAGHRMYRESNGACDHPFVIRLVEYNGEAAEVVLKLPGEVAMAAKVNLMGEVAGASDGATERRSDEGGVEIGVATNHALVDTRWIDVDYPVDPPDWARDLNESVVVNGEELKWSAVRFTMRPHEIATIMADLVMGRKQWRNLDEKRKVWATIHRSKAHRGEEFDGVTEDSERKNDGA